MSSPSLSSSTGRIWYLNRDPESAESVLIEIWNFWGNTTSKDFFICIDATPDALVWRKIAYA